MTTATLLPMLLMGLALAGPLAMIAAVRLTLERFWPAQPVRPAGDRVNLVAWLAYVAAPAAFGPALGGVVTLAVNAAHGGLIVLPSHGAGIVVGFVVYFLAMDLGEYLFHRAQHAVPALWAMHALHHSDPHYDASTTVRHFWLEPVIKSLTVWLAVGLVFKTAPAIVGLYVVATYYNYVIHSNTRFGLKGLSWLVNTPDYHRLHHSASPEHFDCNFAAILPIFDLVMGGYRPPGPGERPRTGLDTGEAPAGIVQTLTWPWRGLRRRLQTGSLQAR